MNFFFLYFLHMFLKNQNLSCFFCNSFEVYILTENLSGSSIYFFLLILYTSGKILHVKILTLANGIMEAALRKNSNFPSIDYWANNKIIVFQNQILIGIMSLVILKIFWREWTLSTFCTWYLSLIVYLSFPYKGRYYSTL